MAAQVDGIRRMLLILNKVRREPYISKAALLAYINDKMDGDYGLGRVSCRTLERDLGNIGYLLGYEICFDASRRGLFDAKDLLVCWKALDVAVAEPREVEKRLISDFKAEHGGQRPFANRQD